MQGQVQGKSNRYMMNSLRNWKRKLLPLKAKMFEVHVTDVNSKFLCVNKYTKFHFLIFITKIFEIIY